MVRGVAGDVPIGKSEVDANQCAIDEMRRVRRDVGYCRANHRGIQPAAIARRRQIAHKRNIRRRKVMQSSRPAVKDARGFPLLKVNWPNLAVFAGVIYGKQGGSVRVTVIIVARHPVIVTDGTFGHDPCHMGPILCQIVKRLSDNS